MRVNRNPKKLLLPVPHPCFETQVLNGLARGGGDGIFGDPYPCADHNPKPH